MMKLRNKRDTIISILLCVSTVFLIGQDVSLHKFRRLESDEPTESSEFNILDFDPLKELSEFYDNVFAWDVDEKNQEIQKQVRIRRECEEHPELDTQPDDFDTDHPDSHITTISCVPVHYRIPTSSIKNIEDPVVYGVLSGHPVHGRRRRDSVRKTWGKDVPAFYVVSGDWDNFEEEYDEFQDLLWIDQSEQYYTPGHNPRKGALTFKSEAFLVAMYNQIVKENPNVEYLFKTDDDCYVDTHLFYEKVKSLEEEYAPKTIDYGGSLLSWNRPDRAIKTRWYASHSLYPFTYFPTYATGGGWVVSPKFLECVVSQGHVAKVPYFVLEDAAVGMLAERCGTEPLHTHGIDYRLRKDITVRAIVQHDVQDDELMVKLHDLVVAALNEENSD